MSSFDKSEHIAASTSPGLLFGASGWSFSLLYQLKEADWPSHVFIRLKTTPIGSCQGAAVHEISLDPQQSTSHARPEDSCLVEDAARRAADLRLQTADKQSDGETAQWTSEVSKPHQGSDLELGRPCRGRWEQQALSARRCPPLCHSLGSARRPPVK